MFYFYRKVHYHETDKMGITHHANYIKFMEEARVSYLNSLGYGYKKLEDLGMISPVISVACEYLRPTTFEDELEVIVTLKDYNGIRIEIDYVMRKNGKSVATGTSKHCFISPNGVPVVIKKEYPEFHEVLMHELADSSNHELLK